MNSKLRKALTLLAASTALAGCASSQLNYNTLDISSSLDSLYTKQALTNLSRFIDEPYAIPAQLDISAGTIQTVNTIQPSLSFPLTSQVADGVTRATSVTLAHTATVAGSGAGLSATNTQQQNWNVTPLSDANTLRNLQALYRHVIYDAPFDDFEIKMNYQPSRVFVDNKFYLDPFQLLQPHCVVCANSPNVGLILATRSDIMKLHTNKMLPSHWLFWTSDPGTGIRENMPVDEPLINLGHFGNHELYMSEKAFANGYLTKFAFFILPNSEPIEVFVSAKAPGPNAAAAAPSTNGRVAPGPGRHGMEVPTILPLGIQPNGQ
jgi:hypothetical protein